MSQWAAKAKAGDAAAMVQLGNSFYTGKGDVAKDLALALEWLSKAAAAGQKDALRSVGYMHEKGEGTPVNLVRALDFYLQAQKRGNGCKDDIARVEAQMVAEKCAAENETLRWRPVRVLEEETERLQSERATLETDKARHQRQVEAWNAEKSREQQASMRVRVAVSPPPTLSAASGAAIVRASSVKGSGQLLAREGEAQQRATKESAIVAKQAEAAAKQAKILATRRSDAAKGFDAKRDAIVAAWAPTAVKLSNCPACVRAIAPGQSVLLDGCLHTLCRDCVPDMLEPACTGTKAGSRSGATGANGSTATANNSVHCPICKVVSTLHSAGLFAGALHDAELDGLPRHPIVEAELSTDDAHTCVACAPMAEEDQLPAVLKCTGCEPVKYYCEPHATVHRKRMPTHAVTPLLHGAAALRCPTHDQPMAAYCTDCRTLVCLACFASTHPTASHATRLLSDPAFVEAVRARLVGGVAAARAVAEALVDHAADATVAVTETDDRDAAVHDEIDRAVTVLIGLIERRREAAYERHQMRSRQERESLQRALEASEGDWRIATSAADLAEQLATGAHLGVNATAVMVQLERVATARLAAVTELAPKRGVPAPSILRFEWDESIVDQLANLGRIVQDA